MLAVHAPPHMQCSGVPLGRSCPVGVLMPRSARAQVDGSMPRDVNRGINAVKRFVRQQGIEGVHGTLIELVSCQPALYTAVEVRYPARTPTLCPCPVCCRCMPAVPCHLIEEHASLPLRATEYCMPGLT